MARAVRRMVSGLPACRLFCKHGVEFGLAFARRVECDLFHVRVAEVIEEGCARGWEGVEGVGLVRYRLYGCVEDY